MRTLKLILLLTLCCTSAAAQPALRSGRPLMSAAPDGLAPLGIIQGVASLPVGAVYLDADAKYPSVFLCARVGVPAARGVFVATMTGSYRQGGQFVFDAPVKLKPFWGKPRNMPAYGCVFNYKGTVLSLWAEGRNSLTLASYNKDSRELSKIASVPVEGLDGVFLLSATELPDGGVEITALCGDGSRYRSDRSKDESWYDGAHIYKGELSKGGLRSMILKDPLKGGRLEPVSEASFITAPTGVVRVKDSFLGADGYLVVNRFGIAAWKDAASQFSPRTWVRDAGGEQLRYHANGGAATLLRFRSGEQAVLVCGEGAPVSFAFEGMTPQGPQFSKPSTVLMRNAPLYTGSLGVPDVADWDGDGVLDIICGNSEGRILFFRNIGSNAAPQFSGFAEEVCCEGEPICFRPGYLGVQGPFEAVWGYMCPTVFDWNSDGLPDIVFSDSRGKLEVMLNRGTAAAPDLHRPFSLKEDGLEIKGLWRVKPAVAKIDGRICIVNLDGNGALHRWWRVDDDCVEDGGVLHSKDGRPVTAHTASAARDGSLGRVKINLCDWDGDGDLDLILGTPNQSCLPAPERGIPNGVVLKQLMMQVFYMENVGTDAAPRFAEPVGFYVNGKDLPLGVHANAPAPCLLGDTSSGLNLLVGCESGRLFWLDRRTLTPFSIKDRYEKK